MAILSNSFRCGHVDMKQICSPHVSSITVSSILMCVVESETESYLSFSHYKGMLVTL